MKRTAEQWLEIPDTELGGKLAETFFGLNHDWVINKDHARLCSKCGVGYAVSFPCVPDPIKIDWNTAMEWRDKIIDGRRLEELKGDILIQMHDIWELRAGYYGERDWRKMMFMWWALYAMPKDWLILAATLAIERKEA